MSTCSSPEQAVLAADDARYRAMLAADILALDTVLSPDLTYTHSNGVTDDKAAFLEKLRRGEVVYQACQRETHRFQTYADVALLHGTVRLKAQVSSRPVELHNHYLTVWVRVGARWQLRAWASTRLPDGPR